MGKMVELTIVRRLSSSFHKDVLSRPSSQGKLLRPVSLGAVTQLYAGTAPAAADMGGKVCPRSQA